MKRVSLLFLSFALFVALSACGSSSEINAPVKKPPSSSNASNATNTGQPNMLDNSSVPNPVDETNSQAGNSMLNRRRKVEPVQQTGPIPPAPMRPAPENSEISTTMNASGQVFETRVFKENPQLAKVEMLWISPTDKKVKIYLKSGKIVQDSGERIDNLTTVSTSVLLEIAGVKPAQPKADQPQRKKKIQ